ncbi:MAG: DUF2961 domain-containing protein [Armatimonadetes bacterium]|nr:DUF2961 domain-containing protein [Candidatus Hippobium faecium]
MFNGLGMNMNNLSRLSDAKTFSISPENFTGEKGKGGMAVHGTGENQSRTLGQKWKVSPSVNIAPGETFVLCDIEGMGAIQQIWMTPSGIPWRHVILRMYWDNQENPSVECPVGDFFCNGLNEPSIFASLPMCVNPGCAFNSYFEMPFRKRAYMTITNISDQNFVLYYQINYTLTEVPEDCAYFHASFRRTNPLPYMDDYTIIDGIKGKGHYVGTYLAIGVNNNGWWGEGEIKFFMDGDKEFPTICGTGTEDYFCGSYNFDMNGKYIPFASPYAGLMLNTVDELYKANRRFGMYRWHITDPVRFENDLKVTIQDIGWRCDGRYLPRQDDMASVAYWYQTLPTAPFKALPDKDYLEII